MRDDAYIGCMNIIYMPIDVIIGKRSCIGNTNKVTRGAQDIITIGRSVLKLGELSSITASHRVDCTSDV